MAAAEGDGSDEHPAVSTINVLAGFIPFLLILGLCYYCYRRSKRKAEAAAKLARQQQQRVQAPAAPPPGQVTVPVAQAHWQPMAPVAQQAVPVVEAEMVGVMMPGQPMMAAGQPQQATVMGSVVA